MKGWPEKRGQYARDPKTKRHFPRIKSVKGLWNLINYLNDEDHPNHDGIKLAGVKTWRCASAEELVSSIVADSATYLESSRGKRGRPWSRDIGEHIIIAPPGGAKFTDEEISMITEAVLRTLCPESPAVYAWHYDPADDRWELHVVATYFWREADGVMLRVTELRRRHGTDYKIIIDEAVSRVARAINQIRISENREVVQTLAGIRAEKIADLSSSLAKLAVEVGVTVTSKDDVILLLEGTHWCTLKANEKSLSVKSWEHSTPLHIRWENLLPEVTRRIDEFRRDREEDRGRESSSPVNR